MGGQQAAPVFGRGVGDGNRGQAQRLLQQGEGIDDPACLLRAGNLGDHVGVEDEAAPGRNGAAQEGAVALVAQLDQRLRLPGHVRREAHRAGLQFRPRRRGFETHDGRQPGLPQGALRLGPIGNQPQAAFERPVRVHAPVTQDGQRHAVPDARLQPPAQGGAPLRRDEAGKPGDDAGVAVPPDALRQALAHVRVVRHEAHVIERHLQKPVRLALVEGRRFVAVVEHQHAARHGFDAADADGGEIGIRHPRDESVLPDLVGRGAGEFPILGAT